jgi:mannose-6-phosphate isomerase-like protein (cupin superfamily)
VSAGPPGGADAALAFPGGTGVTLLDVYDWVAPDGLRGGSAHVHLVSTEGYVVLRGTGRLQTLGAAGFREEPLRPGDCLWFTPGTVHRLVNEDGALQILVIMQNAGLPEAGDCVLTFPPDVLADPARYAAAASLDHPLPGRGGREDAGRPAGRPAPPQAREAAARRRRDLAIDGFTELRAQVDRDGPAALRPFLEAAVRLTAGRVPDWRGRCPAAAVAAHTAGQLAALSARHAAVLETGTVLRAARPAGPPAYGLCGRLTRYDPPSTP